MLRIDRALGSKGLALGSVRYCQGVGGCCLIGQTLWIPVAGFESWTSTLEAMEGVDWGQGLGGRGGVGLEMGAGWGVGMGWAGSVLVSGVEGFDGGMQGKGVEAVLVEGWGSRASP